MRHLWSFAKDEKKFLKHIVEKRRPKLAAMLENMNIHDESTRLIVPRTSFMKFALLALIFPITIIALIIRFIKRKLINATLITMGNIMKTAKRSSGIYTYKIKANNVIERRIAIDSWMDSAKNIKSIIRQYTSCKRRY